MHQCRTWSKRQVMWKCSVIESTNDGKPVQVHLIIILTSQESPLRTEIHIN